MNRVKLRMLAVTLTIFTIFSGLVAYFTSGDTVTNSFSAATLQIKVSEPNWKQNTVIVPEQKIEKDPYIMNIDETPAYVFMQVTVPAERIVLEKSSGDTEKGNYDDTVIVPLFRFINQEDSYTTDLNSSNQSHNSGWYHMETTQNKNSSDVTESYTYLYAWTGENENDTMAVLYPNETTSSPLFNKVIFCNAREDEEDDDNSLSGSMQNIKIKAFAIQSDYLKSATETELKAANVWRYLSK